MRKKLSIIVLSLLLVALITIAAIPMHALFYLHFTEAGNTTRQLDNLLSSLEWSREYEADEFDCSNMAARLCEELRAGGFRCALAMDNGHVWVMVRTKEGVQNVESIYLKAVLSGRTPWYVMHPSLSVLISPLAEFSYEKEELVEKPEPTPQQTPAPVQGRWELMDMGNDTLVYKLVNGNGTSVHEIFTTGGNSSADTGL